MKKKLLLAGGLVILLIGIWLIDYYHYSPPRVSVQQVKSLAEKELKQEVPNLLQDQMAPEWKPKWCSPEVLEVRKIGDKTYLVFKADFIMNSGNQGPGRTPFEGGGYVLGLRLVEKHWGGIALRDGMEFSSSYLNGINPVECGTIADGVFYGYCKDPQVRKVVLEYKNGKKITALVNNRVILTRVPEGINSMSPRFFDGRDKEIEPSYSMKVAFVSEDEKNYRPYTNGSVEWWNMDATNIDCLTGSMVGAVWVFPDQYDKLIQGEGINKVKKLVQEGIPVVFVGMKDISRLAAFNIKAQVSTSQGVSATDIEAIYISMNKQGLPEIGVITLDDSQDSPLLMKSLSLRYQLDLPSGSEPNKPENMVRNAANTMTVTKPVTGGGRMAP